MNYFRHSIENCSKTDLLARFLALDFICMHLFRILIGSLCCLRLLLLARLTSLGFENGIIGTNCFALYFQLFPVMASRQEERKRQLSSYCNTTKESTPLQSRHLNHLIVDNKHKIVFCYIPKVACTSWKTIMAQLLRLNYKKTSVHQLRFDLLSLHSQSKARYILNNYYKFMFVREPFERLLSAYKDKFMRKSNDVYMKYQRKIKRSARVRLGAHSRVSNADIKFTDFILYLIDTSSKGGRFNEHWRHYHRLCYPCEVNYDFIGRYETLEEDARFVLQEAGVEGLVSFPPIRYTTTKDDLRRFYSEVPRDDILQLQKMYRRDFEMFGYKAFSN